MLPRALALGTLATLVPLLVWDAWPKSFPEHAHDVLAAVPLGVIGVACVLQAIANRAALADLLKAAGLGAAFLFWAANQLWPDHPLATLFNDVAVTLFVLDVVFAITGFPSRSGAPAEEVAADVR